MPAKPKHHDEGKGDNLFRFKRGRPSLLTPKRQAKLLGAIEDGLPLKESALIAGISYDTLNRWKVRGQSKYAPPRFLRFYKALQRSQAKAMHGLLSSIKKKGRSDWRASAWILERRHPDIFGRPEHIEAKKEDEKPKVLHPVFQEIKEREHLMGVLSKIGDKVREVKREDEERERERRLRAKERRWRIGR